METLRIKTKAGYSVGHVLNDLCAAMWFSYLLVYFHQVLRLDADIAGYLLLIGQITDGLATPVVGIESDRIGLLGRFYGRRKSWHLFGTVCVMLSFIFIYTPLPSYIPDVTPQFVPMIYYTPFIVIFQIGWASTQVSHLSIIPNLTTKDNERTQLNSYRYAFTVLSSVAVYGLAYAFLESSTSDTLGWADRTLFSHLAMIVVGGGSLFSVAFHALVPEKCGEELMSQEAGESDPLITQVQPRQEIASWHEWFKKGNFYMTAVIYMISRLIVNMSQVYMPFYLTDVLHEPKSMIAVVPLVVFLSGFVTSMALPLLSKWLPHNVTYVLGGISVIMGFIWAYYLADPISATGLDQSKKFDILGVAVFNGVGCAAVLVSSLSITANLIGHNTDTSAFVYGAMSLTDKVANGIAVVTIQNMDPCACDCEDCGYFFRAVLTIGVGSLTIAGCVAVLLHYLLFVRRTTSISVYEPIVD